MNKTLPNRPEHTFQPIVTVARREDGRWDVEFDWSDSYLGVLDAAGRHDDLHPQGEAACDAVDEWVRTLPDSFIIPSKEA